MAAYFFDVGQVGSGVAVREKVGTPRMRMCHGDVMSNGAEVLLRARGDLRDVREQPVGIRTIEAADLLAHIEIRQTGTVVD